MCITLLWILSFPQWICKPVLLFSMLLLTRKGDHLSVNVVYDVVHYAFCAGFTNRISLGATCGGSTIFSSPWFRAQTFLLEVSLTWGPRGPFSPGGPGRPWNRKTGKSEHAKHSHNSHFCLSVFGVSSKINIICTHISEYLKKPLCWWSWDKMMLWKI